MKCTKKWNLGTTFYIRNGWTLTWIYPIWAHVKKRIWTRFWAHFWRLDVSYASKIRSKSCVTSSMSIEDILRNMMWPESTRGKFFWLHWWILLTKKMPKITNLPPGDFHQFIILIFGSFLGQFSCFMFAMLQVYILCFVWRFSSVHIFIKFAYKRQIFVFLLQFCNFIFKFLSFPIKFRPFYA